jgi:hypothetical protein
MMDMHHRTWGELVTYYIIVTSNQRIYNNHLFENKKLKKTKIITFFSQNTYMLARSNVDHPIRRGMFQGLISCYYLLLHTSLSSNLLLVGGCIAQPTNHHTQTIIVK